MPEPGNFTPVAINAGDRARRAWLRILRRPSSVQFIRKGIALTAQTVRIEKGSGGSLVETSKGLVTVQTITIYGIRSHPALADTDMKRLDRLVVDGEEYTIESVVLQEGEIQGFGAVKT